MRHVSAIVPLLVACHPTVPEADRIAAVTVDDSQALAQLDERFLSVAVDSSQLVGLEFWNPDATSDTEWVPIEPYDFARQELLPLASALAPAWLRIGGTQADVIWYDLSEDPVTEPPEGHEGVLTREQFDGVCDFATEAGLDLLFTLNAGFGVRDEADVWLPDNARELMSYAVETGCPVGVWELGNEPNAFVLEYGRNVAPEQYGADMATLAALRDELHPEAGIAGPTVAWWPTAGEFLEYTEPALEAGGEHLDVVSWHYYPQQSERCPVQTVLAEPEAMLDPERLDEVEVWAAEVERATERWAPQAEVWLGETGNAQCGGQPGVSDRFASTFWWLDQAGLMARRGQGAMVRQTLSGADYGILDEASLAPRPDWWASLLWRRLMGSSVLGASSDDSSLRAYAHCAPGVGVTVLAVNLDQRRSVWVQVEGIETAELERWVIEADGLEASELRANGATLLLDSGRAPELQGEEADWLVLPPLGWGFATLADAGAGVCG